MGKNALAVLVTITFNARGVLGDYFLKLASTKEISLTTIWFYIGFAVYASAAFGWVFVMRHRKLATIGVVFFHESLSYYEVAGLILAVASLILLVRFA